ncbi:MAG TPA: YerC/YecD family TrpR-related protein [Acidimicrobiia bacterium]|jgi:TrpR-related protein YerC/YecD|nr:YerC/YecD family TrpR-related protein [Acidimicrobiia bacterium]
MTLTQDWQTGDTSALFEAVLVLRTEDEAAAFFRDLCTLQELADLSHRWAVVRLLDEHLPYRLISEETGASTTTITRINQWLLHGAGGYRLVLDRLRQRRR